MKKTIFMLMFGILMFPGISSAIYDPSDPVVKEGDGPMLMRATAEPTLISAPIAAAVVYRDPGTKEVIKISDEASAFAAMQKYALGISQRSFDSFGKIVPEKLDGQILLNVEDSGKAYLADYKNNNLIYLGKPQEAFLAFQKYLKEETRDEQVSKVPLIPENCESWFDGCNTCFVSDGKLGGCTRKMCAEKEEPKCLQYK